MTQPDLFDPPPKNEGGACAGRPSSFQAPESEFKRTVDNTGQHVRAQRRRARYSVTVRRDADGSVLVIDGRAGWFLQELIDHPAGLSTAMLAPGLRISHFVWLLRKRYGVLVMSETQAHGGEFAGTHAIYSLGESFTMLSTTEAAA